MEKISITINIPALCGSYDFRVPDNMPVRDIQELVIRILNSEYGISSISTDAMLFDTQDGKALRLECSLVQLGISNGDRLLLI